MAKKMTDKMRLDWLTKRKDRSCLDSMYGLGEFSSGGPGKLWWDFTGLDVRCKSPRAAIDAAIRAERKGGKP